MLVEELKADINVTAYDGSNALHLAIASDATSEVIQYLIAHGCDFNKQTYKGPGWQSQMTNISGFSPLMMAVNCNDISSVSLLIDAGAKLDLYTGPIEKKFPYHVNSILRVYEYEGIGFGFNALHIAASMEDSSIMVN